MTARLYASDPDRPRRLQRLPLKPCPSCEATARGCDTNQWLRGRRCCDACTGPHPQENE